MRRISKTTPRSLFKIAKMEQELKIKTADGKYIYGKLRGSLKRPLIVFVHGMTGHMDEHIFFNGARYVEKKGFSSFRFNLYDWRKGARKLANCTIAIHARDLDKVIEYFRRRGSQKVFVVGHSYGGPTILSSHKKQFDAAVLWDPTSYFSWVGKARLVKPLNKYLIGEDWGFEFVLGPRLIQEAERIDIHKLIRKISRPIKIILAGKNLLLKPGKKLYTSAHAPKALKIIPGATHTFDEDGAEEKLFRETYDWLKRWIY